MFMENGDAHVQEEEDDDIVRLIDVCSVLEGN